MEKEMSQIEHLERLNASLRIENERLIKEADFRIKQLKAKDSQINSLIQDYEYEKRRADLLQIDLNNIDDFEYAKDKAKRKKMN